MHDWFPGSRTCPRNANRGRPRAAGSIGAMNADEEDDITEQLLADARKLTGLSLELLGLDPHPDDMTPEQRLQFEPEDLDEMAAASPEDRKTAVGQTLVLAGLLWNSSGVLVDQLFRDLGTLTALDAVTPSDVAGTSVLSSLPPRFAAEGGRLFPRNVFLFYQPFVPGARPCGFCFNGGHLGAEVCRGLCAARRAIVRAHRRAASHQLSRDVGGDEIAGQCLGELDDLERKRPGAML